MSRMSVRQRNHATSSVTLSIETSPTTLVISPGSSPSSSIVNTIQPPLNGRHPPHHHHNRKTQYTRKNGTRHVSQSPRSSPTESNGTSSSNGGINPYQYSSSSFSQQYICCHTIASFVSFCYNNTFRFYIKRHVVIVTPSRWTIATFLQISTLFTFILITSIWIQQKFYYYNNNNNSMIYMKQQYDSILPPITTTTTHSSSSIGNTGTTFLRKVLLSTTDQEKHTIRQYPPRIIYWTGHLHNTDTWSIHEHKSQHHHHHTHHLQQQIKHRLIDVTETFMSHNDYELIVDNGDSWQPPHQHCLPKASWQIQSYPNCNTIHEINLVSATEDIPTTPTKTNSVGSTTPEDSLLVLGEGWFRTTWRLDRTLPRSRNTDGSTYTNSNESVVLKTLRIAREYLSEYYELHRRDAVAMERLTKSPFIVNVYGYCGQSAINELADFPFPGVQNLESFNRRMRGKESDYTNAIKLRMAASIALGVADIHAGGSTDPNDMNVYMTHYDLNPRNIALFSGGRPKINDFNIAEFLQYDPNSKNNATCKFPSRLHEPWWRAPEEMNMTHTVYIDEKVDIYALGNILYHTLTSHSSHGKQSRDRMDEVRPIVAAGIKTPIPDHYKHSHDPNVIAMIKAIDLCWSKDPNERATAEDVAMLLYDALLNATDISKLAAAAASSTTSMVNESSIEDNNNDDDAPDDGDVEDKDAMGH